MQTETKSTHTAGPWAKARGGFKGTLDVVGRENGKPIVVAENFHTEADRALFLAAPELLEHVKLLERSLVWEIENPRRPLDSEGKRLKQLNLDLVRAAIAKAEGR